MKVSFDYQYIGESYFGKIYRPVAKVTFKSPKNNVYLTTWMVVDSGADHTILPVSLAQKLDISVESDCHKDVTAGIGGEQTIYFLKNKIQAQIGKISKKVPLGFLDSKDVPPLLGRLGFMELFEVTLGKNKVVFKE